MIYLDYAATTPCEDEVVEAMLPYLTTDFANASSVDHVMGAKARTAVERAREQVAKLVAAAPENVVFTSGSTEANNLALSVNRPIITSAIEHPSVIDAARHRAGDVPLLVLGVNNLGEVNVAELDAALLEHPNSIVSIMTVNNEIGVAQRVEHLASRVKAAGGLFHTDATQAPVTMDLRMNEWGVDGLSLSAHKIYGPKGVGALVCTSSLRKELMPLLYGGGHERGLRSGTLNVPGIVGFGAAAVLAVSRRTERVRKYEQLRRVFLKNLRTHFEGEALHLTPPYYSQHILSVQLRGVNNRALLQGTSSALCFSLGSACATMKNEPSHVLLALGRTAREANETIRISFGERLTEEDIVSASRHMSAVANKLLQLVA